MVGYRSSLQSLRHHRPGLTRRDVLGFAARELPACLSRPACGLAHRGGQPLEIGLGPQLFLDDHLIDRLEGLDVGPSLPNGWEPVLDSETFGTTQPYVTVTPTRRSVASGSGTTAARPSGTRSPTTGCTGSTRGSPGTCPEATGRASSTTAAGGGRIAVTSSPTGRRPATERTARRRQWHVRRLLARRLPLDRPRGTRSCRPGPRATASRRGTAWATSSTSTMTR